jgi:hypothetical protein
MKTTLTNTTVRSFKNSEGQIEFMIFKGKGTGSQIAGTKIFEEAKIFDANFSNIEYKTIYSNVNNAIGGAYFYKNTNTPVFSQHPFFANGFHF